MKKTISDHIVQDRWSDNCILHRKCFDVNTRLFKTSGSYKRLILSIIQHMHDLTTVNFSDYGTIKGISGANVGVPLNIVGLCVTGLEEVQEVCNLFEGDVFFMINPHITSKSKKTRTVKSNCGSIGLKEKIDVERHEWVRVKYHDVDGKLCRDKFEGTFGSTLQHEIDHNLGVLITDKKE